MSSILDFCHRNKLKGLEVWGTRRILEAIPKGDFLRKLIADENQRVLNYTDAFQALQMARVWYKYVAPDGRNYYYNVLTKQSTWQKPEAFDEVEQGRDAKRFKKIEPKPHVVLELINGWHLVICETGQRFYYNAESVESSWTLPDEDSLTMINSLDKNKLVALIGLARGYALGGSNVYDELVSDLWQMREERERNKSKPLNNKEEIEEEPAETSEEPNGLVAGYSSSDSEFEKETEETQENETKIGLVESVEEPIDTSEDRKALWDLFTRYNLNAFSAWPFEMKKIRQDPDFHRISDDALREDIFEEWCASIISGEPNEPISEEEQQLNEDDEYDENDELEPIKYHYLAQIVSKSTISPTTIFMDIKEENKPLFKKYRIKDFVTSKKDQQYFVSKLLFYYKTMDLEGRKKAFIALLNHHESTIKANLAKDIKHARQLLHQKIDPENPYAVETQLFKMELAIGLWGNLAILVEDPKYYVLGIRDKMLELSSYLKTLL